MGVLGGAAARLPEDRHLVGDQRQTGGNAAAASGDADARLGGGGADRDVQAGEEGVIRTGGFGSDPETPCSMVAEGEDQTAAIERIVGGKDVRVQRSFGNSIFVIGPVDQD
jgi:hypothetical protein